MNEQEENREIRRKIDQGVRLAIAEAVRKEKNITKPSNQNLSYDVLLEGNYRFAINRRTAFLFIKQNFHYQDNPNWSGLYEEQLHKAYTESNTPSDAALLLGFSALEAFINFFTAEILYINSQKSILSAEEVKKLEFNKMSLKERLKLAPELAIKLTKQKQTKDFYIKEGKEWQEFSKLVEMRDFLVHPKLEFPPNVDYKAVTANFYGNDFENFYKWYVQNIWEIKSDLIIQTIDHKLSDFVGDKN